jgi:hypothetical protein
MRRAIRSAAVFIIALTFVGLAAGAQHCRPCHPDLPGTRALTLTGSVTNYGFVDGRVVVRWTRSARCAGTAVWDWRSASRAQASAACQRPSRSGGAAYATKLTASQANRSVRIVLASPTVDRPDRLEVLDRTTRRLVASWPLIERPDRVALYDNIAVLSAEKRSALYALRISDGRIALIGITQPGDRPRIGSGGVLYQDDLDVSKDRPVASNAAPGEAAERRVTLKLLPLATVRRELSRAGRPIQTSTINAISMDGERVAFAVNDPKGSCDRILFWNIPWHFVSRLTQASGPTCLPSHQPGGITDVAIAGSRAVWTTRYGHTTRVLAASIIKCEEWVVARPGTPRQRVAGLAGDGGVLAYALTPGRPGGGAASTVGFVPATWRGTHLVSSSNSTVAVSVDSNRVAILHRDGTIAVVTRGGLLVGRVHIAGARAIALRRGTLAVLRPGRLGFYRVRTGERVALWNVSESATSVDLHYGIALITAGRDVDALNVATGRTAHLLRAPARVTSELEAPGAVIMYNARGAGHLRFLSMSWIEARIR